MAKRKPTPKKKPVDAEKAARKRERRAERQRQEQEAKRRAERKRRMRTGALTAAGVALLGLAAFFVFSLFQPGAELDGVERPADLGRRHLELGETFAYASATPTSGPHAPNTANCGVLVNGLPLENAVHNLEHGVVIVWFRPDLAGELLLPLTNLIENWGTHVIVAPNPRISEPIVATAWNRLKRYDEVTDDLAEFIDTYRRRGPERVQCDIV